MNATTATALRIVYLYTFDCFAVSPTEVADLPEVGNVRYARELLGVLVNAGLVVESDVNGEEVVWQASDTYDTATREQAEATIDHYLAQFNPAQIVPDTKPTRRSKPSKANPAGLPLCLCGCGLAGKSNYRPGHDARHAGNVARGVLAGRIAVTGILAAVYGSEALAGKVAAQVQRGNAKAAAPKAPKQAPKAKGLIGAAAWVKVGRWVKKGRVTSTTVDDQGRETVNSQVCVITYTDAKGAEQSVAVDTAKHEQNVTWGFGHPAN